MKALVNGVRDKTHMFLLRYVFQAAVHLIWRERNGRRHGKKHQTATIIFGFIDKLVRKGSVTHPRKTNPL